MYRTCIFCSSDLGKNEALEHFPVGARLAFDARQGRLWALCGKCGRWNLAPIEERWEAVEEAEKRFRGSRLRVHSENIGLAKLPDGTRLIRVGESIPGELAAWRYGDMLRHRRYRDWLSLGTGLALGGAILGGMHIAAIGGLTGAVNIGAYTVAMVRYYRSQRAPVGRLPASVFPAEDGAILRRIDLNGARLVKGEHGGLAVRLPYVVLGSRRTGTPASILVEGAVARSILGRAMVDANARGASRRKVNDAIGVLTTAGGPEEFLLRAAGEGRSLGLMPIISPWERITLRGLAIRALKKEWLEEYRRTNPPWKSSAPLLALEMALHEESEHRALRGELAGLEAAWKEAEEIAKIADSLLDDSPTESPPDLVPSGTFHP